MANPPFYSQCFAKKTFWRNLWTFTWLVVLTILMITISQWEGLSHIYIYIFILRNIYSKNDWNHQPVYHSESHSSINVSTNYHSPISSQWKFSTLIPHPAPPGRAVGLVINKLCEDHPTNRGEYISYKCAFLVSPHFVAYVFFDGSQLLTMSLGSAVFSRNSFHCRLGTTREMAGGTVPK